MLRHALAPACALVLLSAGCSSSTSGDGETSSGGTETSGGDAETTGGAQATCSDAALGALRQCVVDYSIRLGDCYDEDGQACTSDDPALMAVLDALEGEVSSSCADGEFGALDLDALPGRLRNACASEASSLSWRAFGGPQGAVWSEAEAADQSCLATAHDEATAMVEASLENMSACLGDYDNCSLEDLESSRQALEEETTAAIADACGDLAAIAAVSPETYVERAHQQVDCLTATGYADTRDLDLDCGPGYAQFEATRGEWQQVVVDGGEWGTLCGDGSSYAFQVRLAPEGSPLDRVVVGLQGGGVCLFEDDCTSRLASSPELFNAMGADDEPFPAGISSTNPEDSPFANYTQVYLPYCNQDVFAGGGVDEELGALTLPRYGSVNMRAAVQMVRDVIWKEMDAGGGAGFRPDEVVALFGGWSAGGYGTLYNYHWFLDDLQWPRTMAFPDAGLGLDNGTALGVGGLGLIKIPAWGMLPNLPPYCFEGACAGGEFLFNAISPRLKQVPEQQMLVLTNPFDVIQQGDAFFNDTPTFINALREMYCNTKDLPGIQHYYTSVSDQSLHVVTLRPELWEGEVDGETMRDWFARAVDDPDTLTDRVEEGDFVSVFDGVEPYPCEVAP